MLETGWETKMAEIPALVKATNMQTNSRAMLKGQKGDRDRNDLSLLKGPGEAFSTELYFHRTVCALSF